MGVEDLGQGLEPQLGDLAGYGQVLVLPRVGSTNDYAIELLKGGAEKTAGLGELSLVLTDCQEAGRGRLDRSWQAPAGQALAMTFLLRPHAGQGISPAPDRYHWFTVLLALAACRALEESSGLAPSIKWPNDVLLGQKKVCGILAQLLLEADGQISVAVGIGINVNLGQQDLPVPTATSLLLESGTPQNLTVLARQLASQFEGLYRQFAASGFDAAAPLAAGATSLCDQVKEVMGTLGAYLTVHLPQDQLVRGWGKDLLPSGELLVETEEGQERAFSVGDVVHLRPEGYGVG